MSSNAGSEILRIASLSKSYGGLKAVDNVDLSVEEGSITGLIGPNGSGKSTLFNLMTGVVRRDSGNIFFNGKSIDNLSPDKRFHRGIARGFQDPRLFFKMNVFENMLVPPIDQKGESPIASVFQGNWKQQEIELGKRAKSIMEDLNISEIALNGADEISGGQMKLLQLGQLLMNSPKLILLDEPTAGVAPGLTNEIFETVKRLRNEKRITFLVIEHKLQVLFKYADIVYVMYRGKIFAKGTPEQILSNKDIGRIYL